MKDPHEIIDQSGCVEGRAARLGGRQGGQGVYRGSELRMVNCGGV